MKTKEYIVLLACLFLFFSCQDAEVADAPFNSIMVEVSHFSTDKGAYKTGESVSCSFDLKNETTVGIHIEKVMLVVRNLSVPDMPVIIQGLEVASDIVLSSKESHHLNVSSAFTVPSELVAGTACGLSLVCTFQDGMQHVSDISFIRVADDHTLMTYRIDRESYQGLDVFLLDGGMSAEFGVEKSLASLAGGISHSWKKSKDGGPEPVMMTPDFLQRSLQKTVDMYNDVLGSKTPVKTVVIGTGVPSVSYLSTAMKAPYLPIHFLGGANTAQEVQSVLDDANDNGHPSYATLGYDGSISGVGVAWIKLLELPAEYEKFLVDHQVQEVILLGVGEKVIGESYARKVITDKRTGEYGDRSLYVQYTQYGSSSDVTALTSRIYDFKSLRLDENRLIADWESGILDRQIDAFSKSIKEKTAARPYSLSCLSDMISLYNLATTLAAFTIKKNESNLSGINGVAFNEYLFCQPLYGLIKGYVPLLYWQFVPPSSTVGRAMDVVKPTIARYDPQTNFNELAFYLNSGYGSNELRGGLISNGIPASKITVRGDQVIWNPADGMLAPCEVVAEEIVKNMGLSVFKDKLHAVTPLDIDDLKAVSEGTFGVVFSEK